MRLIDADALKEAMDEHTDYKGYLVCDPEEIIDNAPTVERPHGEWKYEPTKGAFCSACGWHSIWEWNFCPCCGADMREGDPDDRRRD